MFDDAQIFHINAATRQNLFHFHSHCLLFAAFPYVLAPRTNFVFGPKLACTNASKYCSSSNRTKGIWHTRRRVTHALPSSAASGNKDLAFSVSKDVRLNNSQRYFLDHQTSPTAACSPAITNSRFKQPYAFTNHTVMIRLFHYPGIFLIYSNTNRSKQRFLSK